MIDLPDYGEIILDRDGNLVSQIARFLNDGALPAGEFIAGVVADTRRRQYPGLDWHFRGVVHGGRLVRIDVVYVPAKVG